MKTRNFEIEPIIYQYRFEHRNHSIDSQMRFNTPHLMEIRNAIRNNNSSNPKKELLTKMTVFVIITLLFTALSLVF